MTASIADARLRAACWECQRHRDVLSEALADWQAVQPKPDLPSLEADKALRRLTDQILYRFTKLQDAMGERLVPATLGWLREPFEEWPMRDRLDRLERLRYLDVDEWLQWRDVRNRLAHEYPDETDLRQAALWAAIEAATALAAAHDRWRQRLPA